MADNGTPTPGGDAGAKISDTKSGVVTKLDKPTPIMQPQQPVRH